MVDSPRTKPNQTLNESKTRSLCLDDLKLMALIRSFEQALLSAFKAGEIRGTTHTCIGQEASAVASMAHVSPADVVLSSHRAHGHFLAYGGDPEKLLLEIVGHPDGICHGLGGSQHLHQGNFYTNGLQGGIVPIAVGAGLSLAKRGQD